jgi:hypothetical protein
MPVSRRAQVGEMEASAKRLKDRCAALLAGAKRYRDGISGMLDAQSAFAAALADFGGGSDEESLHLGVAPGGGRGSAGGAGARRLFARAAPVGAGRAHAPSARAPPPPLHPPPP